jgi:hypothetical protein
MSDVDDPLAHLSDPAKRFENLGKIRGAEVAIEITGDVTKQDVVSPCLAVLIAAADVNMEGARILKALVGHMEQRAHGAAHRAPGTDGDGIAEQN